MIEEEGEVVSRYSGDRVGHALEEIAGSHVLSGISPTVDFYCKFEVMCGARARSSWDCRACVL